MSNDNSNFTLLHYTSKKINKLYSVPWSERVYFKPVGLWLSVNDSWLQWCDDNMFSTFDFSNHYIYTINNAILDTNLYFINSIEDLLLFYKKFKSTPGRINWKKLYKKYDGIAFFNYSEIKQKLHELYFTKNNTTDINNNMKIFMDFTWYFGLDISCVCIWNTTNIILENETHIVDKDI